MAGLTVRIEGDKAILAGLNKLNPGLNHRITNPAMVESMLRFLRNASQRQIVRGGPKGAKPRAKRLTSRTGRLRASLAHKTESLDKSGLPGRIEGGSNLVHSRHEDGFGGRIRARPYLAPALAEELKNIPGIFRFHWERQL